MKCDCGAEHDAADLKFDVYCMNGIDLTVSWRCPDCGAIYADERDVESFDFVKDE